MAAHRGMARGLIGPPLRLPVAARGKLPVFFYSQVAWDTVWQRPQEQAMGLAAHRPVLFFSPVQLHELAGRLWDRWQPLRSLAGGRLLVASPVLFSGEYRNATIRGLNRQVMRRVISRFPQFRQAIYLTNSPFSDWFIDELRPKSVVYDLIDDFCSFEWAPPEGVLSEDRLIREADLAFAGTGALREKYAHRLEGLEFLPSGVNYPKLTAPADEPEEIRKLPHPRLLYVGTLNDRMNPELFRAAGQAVPHGSVVVVGPRHETFRPPKLPPNVHFLGLMPHDRLPGFYQHCDLGIMPFADNAAARAINPVKTLEFLACALPVLSTPIPDVIRYYPDVVTVAEPADWPARIRELLASDSPELRARRSDFARGKGWDRLVDSIESQLARFDP